MMYIKAVFLLCCLIGICSSFPCSTCSSSYHYNSGIAGVSNNNNYDDYNDYNNYNNYNDYNNYDDYNDYNSYDDYNDYNDNADGNKTFKGKMYLQVILSSQNCVWRLY